MPIFSLDNNYSIGSFGVAAKKFVDFLHESGFTWWQVLPLCVKDEFNCPYNSSSVYSIDPYYIDLELLFSKGLISAQELHDQRTDNDGKCNFQNLNSSRLKVLYNAFLKFDDYYNLEKFIACNPNIKMFCKYMSLCAANNTYFWNKWTKLNYDKNVETFWQFLQYEAFIQWLELKEYANSKNIKIMGDLPLYSSFCSSDVYFNMQYYQFDQKMKPIYLSGARPDSFSSSGQCWGHPVYNWEVIKKDNFDFWIEKFSYYSKLYDGIRLDHFRGFESFWVVPANTRNALEGHFEKGPGIQLFSAAKKYLKTKIIVGEDLGTTTQEVQKLIDKAGFYNMRVFQYCLSNSLDLPINYSQNCIAYTGTHDNNTLMGYINNLSDDDEKVLRKKLNISQSFNLFDGIIYSVCQSNAKIIFFPIQDILKMDSRYVINSHIPSTNNWNFRIKNLIEHEATIKRFVYFLGAKA